MAAEYEEQLVTTNQSSTLDIWDLAPDTPTALPRGVGSKVGNAGGNTGIVTTLGWESDWTTMMYLGAGLGTVILILAIFVCCLLKERKKQEVIRRAQLEAAYRVMVPLWGPRLVTIFVMDPTEVHWIITSGNYSDGSYVVHRRSLNMTTEKEELAKTIQQSLHQILNNVPDQPYHLPRGSYGIGKAGGKTSEVNRIGWEGDWTTMLYLGAVLGVIILILSISVCCVQRKWKQERIQRAQIEAASSAMLPVWDYGVPVVLKAPVMHHRAIEPMRYYTVPRREQVIV
ncbi:Hypp7977 [Branchiostoma lanceolatum]|uniref:Hypp7977 protein n=1 Tax=Branchiostoma lanceolatum TaxID=7740 RepID=A0A8K0EC73_BRALA|nr:Hypp7977 [Branchiostoma lanceolatum]